MLKILKTFVQNSEIRNLLRQSKEIYKTQRTDSGKMHSAYTAAKHTGKELGFINSVFTLIGFIGGAISPIPAGSILGAEGMLKASKFIGKHINKAVGKNLDKIA